HRDIKPSNLMLAKPSPGQSPLVKILDLGLAKALDVLPNECAASGDDLTTTGQVMGTLDYMAPEQGSEAHRVDIRTDIYSLGATFYKLLTGEAPFAAHSKLPPLQRLMAIATSEPPPIQDKRPEVPDSLAAIIHRMLAKDPDQRFGTPIEVIEALLPFCERENLRSLQTEQRVSDKLRSATGHRIGMSAGNTWFPRSKAISALGGLAAILILGIVLTISTRHGTVTVESPDEQLPDDLSVAVSDGGREVALLQADNDWTLKLVNGNYKLSLRGGEDQFVLSDSSVTVSRLGRSLIIVKRLPVASAEPNAATNAAGELDDVDQTVLVFDGVDDYLELPPLQLDVTQPFTIEAILRAAGKSDGPDSTTDAQFAEPLFSLNGPAATSGPRLNLQFDRRHRGWRASRAESGDQVGQHVIAEGAGRGFHHVALTFDGTNLQLYRYGKPIGSPTTATLAPSRTDSTAALLYLPTIGCADDVMGGQRQFFAGEISEFRISTRARTPDEFHQPRLGCDADTLVLYHYDEQDGVVVHDLSGNYHEAVIHGAAWSVVPGSAPSPRPTQLVGLSFDGVDDYIEVPILPSPTEKTFTVEAIIELPAAAGPQEFGCIARSNGVSLKLNEQRQAVVAAPYEAGVSPRVLARSATIVPAGIPCHIAGVIDDSHVYVYINGRLVSHTKYGDAVVISESTNFRIGSLVRGDPSVQPFHGRMYGVRISHAARYKMEFTPPSFFEPDDDTVLLYNFDEGAGETVTDLSSNHFDGKLKGSTWFEEGYAPNTIGDFDGVSSHVVIPDIEFSPDQTYTMEAWVRPDDDRKSPVWSFAGRNFSRGLFSPKTGGFYAWGESDMQIAVGVIQPRRWQHVCATWGPGLSRVAVNGRSRTMPKMEQLRIDAVRVAGSFLGGDMNSRDETVLDLLKGQLDDVRLSLGERYGERFDPPGIIVADAATLFLYDFENVTGDLLVDRSGNSRHGRLVNVVTKAASRGAMRPAPTPRWPQLKTFPTSGITISGRTHAATIEELVVDARQHPITIECFIRTYTTTGSFRLLSAGPHHMVLNTAAGRWSGSLFGVPDDEPMASVADCTSAYLVTPHKWGHLASVWHQDRLDCYMNGVRVSHRDFHLIESEKGTSCSIGMTPNGIVAPLFADLSEIRISNVARYSENFVPALRHEPDENTLLLLHCDTLEGDVLIDSSPASRRVRIPGIQMMKSVEKDANE
ncbi:MAG: hypothetical protein KDB01_01820, partial [Planctomycetaceae bacterium]|nr:hypothetical protein [Planctomycetaceae bacterium]